MQPNRSIELGTGLFVLLGFAALFFLTTQLPGSALALDDGAGYTVTAAFDNIGDLKEGAPVSMSGVRIGRVASIRYDSERYQAVVTLRIDPAYRRIPEDSFASIQTTGLLGGKFVDIAPGGGDTYLQPGGQIVQTQSAIVLENLINKFFADFASRGNASRSSSSDESSDGTASR
ncbi:MAG: outer membrane lipid asymmetry maintenance protein MlaD [Steroidobacteraceae bacterium]|nr:outer membrane lipid asymmetry maintenance protein MlaD [Steroidobacteraceae bacterium]MDW8258014.1 outer membrane lipid asymmetry maintenance protein MlaD [Gammaproteobacteria bacterium]